MPKKSKNKQIIFASCKEYPLGNADLQNLCVRLNAGGFDAQLIPWQEIEVSSLTQETLILPLAAWDYSLDVSNFVRFLESLKNSNIEVLNPVNVLLWNLSKKYLIELRDKGFPIIPSVVLERGFSEDSIPLLLETFKKNKQWDFEECFVIKPLIGQSGMNVKFLEDDFSLQDYPNGALIQPFLSGVKQGEICLIYLQGKFSHSILRLPKTEEWRANSAYGANIIPVAAQKEWITLADSCIQSLPFQTLYARIDLLQHANRLFINEVECIEPALYFANAHSDSLESFLSAISRS